MSDTTTPLSTDEQRAELMRQVQLLYKQFGEQLRQGKNLRPLFSVIFRDLAHYGMAGTMPLTTSNFVRSNYETDEYAHRVFAESACSYLAHRKYNDAVAAVIAPNDSGLGELVTRHEVCLFTYAEHQRAWRKNPALKEYNLKDSGVPLDQVLTLLLKDVEVQYARMNRTGKLPPYPLKNYRVQDGGIAPEEPPSPNTVSDDGPKPPKPLEGGAELELVEEHAGAPAIAAVSSASVQGRIDQREIKR